MATMLEMDKLPDGTDFEGYLYGGINSSFIWVEMQPGEGPRLHRHPYAEIFVILNGEGTYTVGNETIVAGAGMMLIAPAETPHKFINSGTEPLRQVDIHANDRFVTEWLE